MIFSRRVFLIETKKENHRRPLGHPPHKDEYEDVFQDVYAAVVRFMKLCGINP